jgi:hypothetical protein
MDVCINSCWGFQQQGRERYGVYEAQTTGQSELTFKNQKEAIIVISVSPIIPKTTVATARMVSDNA